MAILHAQCKKLANWNILSNLTANNNVNNNNIEEYLSMQQVHRVYAGSPWHRTESVQPAQPELSAQSGQCRKDSYLQKTSQSGSVSGKSGKNTRWQPYTTKKWLRKACGRLEKVHSTIIANSVRQSAELPSPRKRKCELNIPAEPHGQGNNSMAMESAVDIHIHCCLSAHAPTPQADASERNKQKLIDQKDNHGLTALHRAAESGDINYVRFLIQHQEASLNMLSDITGRTALSYAAHNGHKDIVKLLVEEGAKLDHGKTTALYGAVKNRYSEIAEYLLQKGADPNHIHIGSNGITPFGLSIQLGNFHLIKLLYHHRGSVHCGGITPLEIAVRSGNIDAAKFLVEAGASITDSKLVKACMVTPYHCQNVRTFLEKKGVIHKTGLEENDSYARMVKTQKRLENHISNTQQPANKQLIEKRRNLLRVAYQNRIYRTWTEPLADVIPARLKSARRSERNSTDGKTDSKVARQFVLLETLWKVKPDILKYCFDNLDKDGVYQCPEWNHDCGGNSHQESLKLQPKLNALNIEEIDFLLAKLSSSHNCSGLLDSLLGTLISQGQARFVPDLR